MNQALVALIAEKNAADIEAIVANIGVSTLLQLAPHFMAIAQTVQAAAPKQGG